MKTLQKIYLSFFIALLPLTCWSQNSIQQQYFSFSSQYGFTIPSVQTNKYFIQSRLTGLNLYLGKTNSDSASWSESFRNPIYGAGMQYQQFTENEILGNAYTFYYKISIPFFPVNKVGFYYSTAIGTTIIPKSFHPQVYYLNHANGSKFNVFAHFGLQSGINFYKNYILLLAVNYYHISNGNIKLPNNGLNLLAAEIGVNYKFQTIKNTRKFKKPIRENNTKYLITISAGSKQTAILGNNYSVFVAETNYYPFSFKKRSLGMGVDLVADKSLKNKIQNDSILTGSKSQYLYSGIYFSHTLNLNKVQIVTNLGVYIDYYKIINENLFYYLGLRYSLYKNIIGSFGLKANLNGGDYLTWGVGYYLK
ncbi:MAG: acyloxyacyl hydrolase [Chlorobi bacterium]|nr:acyloxyacyl hydrolase [Chlorobiota bacterium]